MNSVLNRNSSKRLNIRSDNFGDLKHIDFKYLFSVLILVFFGIIAVYDASVFYASQNFGFGNRFLIYQSVWVVVGLISAFVAMNIDVHFLKRISGPIFLLTIAVLFFILLPTPFAPEIYGAQRWFFINPSSLLPKIPFLGVLGFQPSELVKLTGIIFGSAFFSSAIISKNFLPPRFIKSSPINSSKNPINLQAIKYFFIVLFVAILIAEEPDFTTAIVVSIILLSLAFFAGTSYKIFITFLVPVIMAAVFYAMSSPYRMERITTLFKPDNVDDLGSGYHIRQIMIALGSGGFSGIGFGNSRQKYAYLPEVMGDSIFAVLGEELGFIGTSLILAIFLSLLYRGFKIASRAKTDFESLLVKGLTVWIGTQAIINLLAMVRLIPLTGIPLPFVSYGGSAMVFMLIGVGLIINVSKRSSI
jgi:cell division protein FtsW